MGLVLERLDSIDRHLVELIGMKAEQMRQEYGDGGRESGLTELERLLDAFRIAMFDKFVARHEKQHMKGLKSVLDTDFDFQRDIDHNHLERHLREEMHEWLDEKADRAAEAIDVAKMIFLHLVF